MFFENLSRPLRYRAGDSCQLCHVDSIAAIRGPGFHRAQEYDSILRFLDRDMVILDTRNEIRKLCKLMIMRSKDSFRLDMGVDMLDHGPSDRQPIERSGPSANLIENNQAFRRGRIQDDRGFCHLNHKSRSSASEVI